MIYLVREQLFVGWDNHLNLWPLRYNFPVWLCVQITHKFVSVSTDPKIHAFSFTFFWVFDKSSVDYDIYQTFWWIFNQSHPYLISNQLIGCIHLKASFADFQKPQFVLLKFSAKNRRKTLKLVKLTLPFSLIVFRYCFFILDKNWLF